MKKMNKLYKLMSS